MRKMCSTFYQKIISHLPERLRGLHRDTVAFIVILSASTLFRLFYISNISVYDMQNDVGTPYENYGHLGYISYLMNNARLPDFDVREAFQFWHPPLHHGISALFLKLVWLVFPAQRDNYESLQLLPLAYITISIWLIWMLLKLWGIEGKALAYVAAITAFNPTFIMLSGSMNNDALCVMLSLLSLYLAILWYRNPGYRMIVCCALSIGLGMFSKGTAAVMAFPMAFLFFMGLIRYRKKVIGQLFLFAIISLPLGLWWYLRNYILFGLPINYIYRSSIDAIGYLGEVPIWKRILDFNPVRFSFSNLYVQFEGKYMEINPVIALLKSTVYGQSWFNYNIYIRLVAYPLVFIWIFFTGLCLYAGGTFLKKDRQHRVESISILILFGAQFISYYSFCLSYPYVWTMDIRYAVSLLACHSILLGEFMKNHESWEKVIKWLTVFFVLITVMCFVMFSFTTVR